MSPERSDILESMAALRTVEIKTGVPGPRSEEILARKQAVVSDALSIALPVIVDTASGATITDVDGNTFIDFVGGVGCLNVGHCHPHVVAAVQEQAERFLHTDFSVIPYEVYVALSERLLEVAPISGPKKAAFFNAGTEAVENAIKFARSYTGRPAVIAFEGGFHGRTLLSLSLTSKTHPTRPASARSRPRSTASRSQATTGGPMRERRSRRSSGRSSRRCPRSRSRRS